MTHKVVRWNSLSCAAICKMCGPCERFGRISAATEMCARRLYKFSPSSCRLVRCDAMRCRHTSKRKFFFSSLFIFFFMAKNFQMNDYVNYTSKPIWNCVHFHHCGSLLLSSRYCTCSVLCCHGDVRCAEENLKEFRWWCVVVAAAAATLCMGRKIHILL